MLFILLGCLLILLLIIGIILLVGFFRSRRQPEYYDPDEQRNAPSFHDIEEMLFDAPEHFYWKKDSCMTPNESRMFFYLNCALDNLLPDKLRKYYFVFPQVSLYSIIGISDRRLSDTELAAARKNLLKKNADFLICHCDWKNFSNQAAGKSATGFYAYKPVLWIELDGSSHTSAQQYGWKNLFDQQVRDQFKDNLAKHLDLPLLRYSIADDAISPADQKRVESKIAEILHF